MDSYEATGRNEEEEKEKMEIPWSVWKQMKSWSKTLILIFTPILLSPLAAIGKEGQAAFVIFLMAIFWIFDVAPIAAVALLPVLLYPFFGIMKASDISPYYLTDINMLFFCGLMIAVAIESWNLHKRIALKIILFIGVKPERILLGFMLTTALISMWMSNTATAAMMVPIADAVLIELEKSDRKRKNSINESSIDEETTFELEKTQSNSDSQDSSSEETCLLKETSITVQKTVDDEKKAFKNISTALMLSIAFSANIGGVATLIGTGPNVILIGQLDSLFGPAASITFFSWMVFAVPVVVLILFGGYLCLSIMYLDCSLRKFFDSFSSSCCKKTSDNEFYRKIVLNEYNKLGDMKFAEKAVSVHFVLVALLWLFRDPKFIPGWASFFDKGYVSDATAGMLVVLMLFIFPSEKPKIFCWNGERRVTKPPGALLTWEMMSKKFAWHLLILLGGGLAMAAGAKESGLTLWLGCRLTSLSKVPVPVMVLVVCLLVATLTEVSSNVGTISLFLPIVATVAQSIGIHPYYLMIPSTIASSFAFMLPVATAPNAIVFSTGRITVKDMVKAGIWMDIVGVLVLMFAINTYGRAYFHLDELPSWVKVVNKTVCS